jgi:hypothetical protein
MNRFLLADLSCLLLKINIPFFFRKAFSSLSLLSFFRLSSSMPRFRHVLAILVVVTIITTGFYLSYESPERSASIPHEQAIKVIVPLIAQNPMTTRPEQEQYITYLPHR